MSDPAQTSVSPADAAGNPIIEAVIDIECEMPPNFDLTLIEAAARSTWKATYPVERKQFMQEHRIESAHGATPAFSVRSGLRSLLFLHPDEKQIVQARTSGFSFNRLSPYSTLDDYVSEIHRRWDEFRLLAAPRLIRQISLRYINRLMLPFSPTPGRLELDDYLAFGPKLPDEDTLILTGFLHQHAIIEKGTGHRAAVTLTAQPQMGDKIPVIFDILAHHVGPVDVDDWSTIGRVVSTLRALKNRIFERTLTQQCRKLYPSLQ